MSQNPTTPLSKDELEKAHKILECCYADLLRAVIKNGRVTPIKGYMGLSRDQAVLPGMLKTMSEDIASVEHRIWLMSRSVEVSTDQLAALRIPSEAPAE